MISAQNLLLNVVAQADASKSTQSGSQTGSLNLTVDNLEQNKEDSQQNGVLDPNTFMLLLSQVFVTNNSEQTIATTDKKLDVNPDSADSDKQQVNVNDLTSANANILINQMQPDVQVAKDTDTKQSDAVTSNVALNQINDNPALSWIDSSSFQSMTSVDKPAVIDSKTANDFAALSSNTPKTDSLANKSSPVLQDNNEVNASSQEDSSVEIPASVINDKSRSDAMQSLQQLSSGIATTAAPQTSKKADSLAPDALNVANNPQAVVTPNQTNNAVATQTKALEIAVPVTDPQWSNKLSEHIVWLGQNQIKSAVIKIHPEELGPLQINIKVDKDIASINIVSHSAQVRDIVDQALPRLRDMMFNQGVHLADVQVSADQRSNQFAQNSNSNNQQQNEHAGFINDADEEVQLVTSVKKGPKGLVDYFA